MMARKLALITLLVTPLASWAQGTAPPPPSYQPREIGITLPQPSTTALPGQPAPIEKFTLEKYRVADLVVPIQGLDYPIGARKEGEAKTKEDWLIKKIIGIVARNTWEGQGGSGTIRYFPRSMALVVDQTPQVQAQVKDLLETMLRVQNVEVTAEMSVGVISDKALRKLQQDYPELKENGQTILSGIQFFTILEKAQENRRFKVYEAPRITLFPGQRAGVDVNPFPGQRDVDKLDAKVRMMVDATLTYVDLELNAEVFKTKFERTIHTVDGGYVILSARKDENSHVLFMVVPRVIINPGREEIVSAPKVLPKAAIQTGPDGIVVQASATAVAPAPSFMNPSTARAPSGTNPENRRLAKLLKNYEEACEAGDHTKARKMALRALAIDPACFQKKAGD